MWRSTPELVRVLRQRYEETDQSLTSIAAEFAMSIRTLGRMRLVEGWRKRSDRMNDLPIAVQLLEEAKALAAKPSRPAHSRESGNPEEAQRQSREEQSESPLPINDMATPSPIERMEALVLAEIAAAEAARAQVTDKRQLAKVSDRTARTPPR